METPEVRVENDDLTYGKHKNAKNVGVAWVEIWAHDVIVHDVISVPGKFENFPKNSSMVMLYIILKRISNIIGKLP